MDKEGSISRIEYINYSNFSDVDDEIDKIVYAIKHGKNLTEEKSLTSSAETNKYDNLKIVSSKKYINDNSVKLKTISGCKFVYIEPLIFWEKQKFGFHLSADDIESSKWTGKCDSEGMINGKGQLVVIETSMIPSDGIFKARPVRDYRVIIGKAENGRFKGVVRACQTRNALDICEKKGYAFDGTFIEVTSEGATIPPQETVAERTLLQKKHNTTDSPIAKYIKVIMNMESNGIIYDGSNPYVKSGFTDGKLNYSVSVPQDKINSKNINVDIDFEFALTFKRDFSVKTNGFKFVNNFSNPKREIFKTVKIKLTKDNHWNFKGSESINKIYVIGDKSLERVILDDIKLNYYITDISEEHK